MSDTNSPEYNNDRYNIRATESKWQKIWNDNNAFKTDEDSDKEPFYVLEMFPYPSGAIHVGHVRNYTLGDVIARYKRAKGFNVLHPMGWDAFGLPAENAAIERGAQPATWTYENIATMRDQLKLMGLSLDWDREIATCHPEYFRHEQAMFLDFLKNGLAYQKVSTVNWDPVENTVLANEQVVDGKGWRSGAPVERKNLKQWFLKTTEFADELLSELDNMPNWPERVKTMQKHWIGKSEGVKFGFDVEGHNDKLEVYSTRPDTIFGVTFCAIAPEHPLALKVAENNQNAQEFIKECQGLGTSEDAIEKAEKKGFKTEFTAIHPFTGAKLPIYIGNYVLYTVGTGAVMGVPAHDARDNDFAKKYGLEIPVVERNKVSGEPTGMNEYGTDDILENSGDYSGMNAVDAKEAIIEWFETQNLGQRTTNFRLRDWGVSRQRYWGCPIPVVYRVSDGACIPVPKDQLPITLPDDVDFSLHGNPLDNHPTWKHTTCPETGEPAIRETDTFDTFFESSWYFARYTDPRNQSKAFEADKANKWLPVDQYIGGVEHAVMHLLYARFFTRALKKCGYLDIEEPFKGLYTQGMVNHRAYKNSNDKWVFPTDVIKNDDGSLIEKGSNLKVTAGAVIKMSKSKKNVIDPTDIFESYGADAARLFILSDSPPDRDLEWSEAGLDGAWRFINKLYRSVQDTVGKPVNADVDNALARKTHQTIAGISNDIENFHYNKSVARIRELYNAAEQAGVSDDAYTYALQTIVQLLSPIVPHLCEELWESLGHKTPLYLANWPTFNEAFLMDENVTIGVQINGKVRGTITVPTDIDKDTLEKEAMNDDHIAKYLDGKTVRKIIAIPGKIVNIVVSDAA